MPEPNSNEFREIYSTYSDLQLVAILHNKADYQPTAIEAAQAELDSRNISTEAIEAAKAKLPEPEPLVERKPFSFSTSGLKSPTGQIGLICTVLGAIYLYSLSSQGSFIWYLLKDDQAVIDFTVVFYLLPFLYLPITLLLFFKQKKAGWVMLLAWAAYSLSNAIIPLIYTVVIPLKNGTMSELLRDLSVVPQWLKYSFALALNGGLLFILNRRPMLMHFNISRNLQLSSIGVGFIWVAITTAVILLKF